MDKKYLMIGGAGVLAVLFFRHNAQAAAAAAQANAAPAMPLAMYSLPVSSGISDGASQAQAQATPAPDTLNNLPPASAPSATMSSPDMTSLLSGLLAQQAQTQTQQILANQNAADSQALASLNLVSGGTATLTHSANGTTLNVAGVPQHATIDPVQQNQYNAMLQKQNTQQSTIDQQQKTIQALESNINTLYSYFGK